MEKLDISELVTGISIVTRVSQKTSKPYSLVAVHLKNDYDMEFFPERAEMKLINLLVKQHELAPEDTPKK